MTKNLAVQALLTMARSEIGYHEKRSNQSLDDKTANSGSGNWTKYARDLDSVKNFYNGNKNGYAWCDVFVDWCFAFTFGPDIGRQMLCQPENSAGAGCQYSMGYFRDAGRYFRGDPQPGDQIFFYSGGNVNHTGIVERVDESAVYTIEGNTSDRVAQHRYARNNGNIAGYGRPRWELAANQPDPGASTTDAEQTAENDYKLTLPELKYGAMGDAVYVLQGILNLRGFDSGEVDGEFGPKTLAAVNKFLMAVGLKADGAVTAEVWGRLLDGKVSAEVQQPETEEPASESTPAQQEEPEVSEPVPDGDPLNSDMPVKVVIQ